MRWIIRFGVGLAVVVLLGLGLLAMVPADRVAAAVSEKFESMTGRALALQGDVRPRLWPSLGVTTGPVSIANADWATSEAPLFRAESLTVDINLGALLGGEVKILGLTADQPQIDLERAGDGRENWILLPDETGSVTTGSVPAAASAFTLDAGQITNGSIRFNDRQSDRVIALEAVDARLSIPDYSGMFTLAATGRSGGSLVTLDLTGGVYSAFAAGRVVPLTANLTTGGSKLAFDGRGGFAPLVAEGTLAADLSDLPALGALLGAGLDQPAAGFGKDSLALSGQVTLDGDGAAILRGVVIEADGNRLTGDLNLRPGDARPKILGQLTAGPIRVGTGPQGDMGGGAAGGMQADGWPDGMIDVSALGSVDAEIELAAPSLDLGVLKLGETRALFTLDRARAVTQIRQMAGYGGQIGGEFVVNGRGGLSVGGKLSFTGIDMQSLLADLAGYDRLVSTGNLELQFLGVGNSVAAIMQGLRGEGALELGQGELRGLDIAGMLRTLDPGFVGEGQKTIFDGLAGTFTIADGTLSNRDLKLVAPYLTASGEGEVGLGNRTLDYRLRPTALSAEDGTGGVMVPLLITGPWAEPRFRLDLEGIAREKMELEAKAVEERAREAAKAAEAAAKAELEARLRDELGVVAGEDETLGDAARRGAEQVLEEEARKLLEDILGGD
ncbi:AsmA family protein [Tabrizicola sp.]|uniref:AsmA family protein n=1 Tax=Tabrizicola sp. TaxID=2005166 RepID=UPI002609CD55|nr:AsmA family protein [Tabrizicola sp.]MDM7932783.1 AsmA family protein [Tabrizicola sp.]